MERREVLGIGDVVLASGFGGYTTFQSDEAAEVILTHVELGNAIGAPTDFQVRVEYEDEVVYEDTHEVGPAQDEQQMGGEVIELDTPVNPGETRVTVEVEDESTTIDFSSEFAQGEYDEEEVIAVFTYGMRGEGDERALTATIVPSDR